MKQHIYTVQKGDSVRPEFVGTKITLANAESLAEALESGHFASEAAVIAAANAQRNIDANRAVRKILSKEGASVTDAVTAGNAIKRGVVAERATPATATPATVKKNAAASSGNRLFERAEKEPDFLARMVKQGVIVEAEFTTWQVAKSAPAPEKKARTPRAAPTA